MPFEFGGTAEPDLTSNPSSGAQGSLEIHRGAFSVFDDLQQSLEKELAAKGAVLTVRLDEWPLDVPGRNLLHTRISDAAPDAFLDGVRDATTDPAPVIAAMFTDSEPAAVTTERSRHTICCGRWRDSPGPRSTSGG